MKHRLFWIVIAPVLFLINACNLEVIDPVAPETKWETQLGASDYDEGHAVLVKDSLIFVLGREKNGSGNTETVLYKLGKKGQALDRKVFTSVGTTYGAHMVFGPNQDIYVMSPVPGYKFNVTKVNISNLSSGLSKTYSGIDPQGMVVTSNGEVVVSGFRLSSTFSGGIFYLNYEARMMRLNANLDSLWSRPYFDTEEGTFYNVVQTPSFELVTVGGYTPSGASDRQGLISRTSANGILYDQGQVGLAGSSELFRDVIRESAGTYVAGGNSSASGLYDPFFARIGSDLEPVTQKTNFSQLTGTNEVIYDIEPTSDGGFVAVGYQWVDGVEADIFLMKLDSQLNYQWHKTFGGTFRDYAYEVEVTPDGGFVIVGFTAVNESNYDIKVIRTNALGEAE
jgi:hypothetical protein